MSSDAFMVRVDRNDGRSLVLSVLTGTSGGLTDLAYSRSFVLHALHELVKRAVDVSLAAGLGDSDEDTADDDQFDEDADQVPPRYSVTGERVVALLPRMLALQGHTALHRALPRLSDDEAWYREHVGEFIVSTTLRARYNVDAKKISHEVEELQYESLDDFQWRDRMWAVGHSYVIEVELTDACWGEHAVVGWEVGTTAFDWWYKDPQAFSTKKALAGTKGAPPPIPTLASLGPATAGAFQDAASPSA